MLCPLKLELQAGMSSLTWVLGIELGPSGRALSALFTEPPL